jgi:putative transposase
VSALKLVKQNYSPSEEVLGLLATFRKMVNVCLGIGLDGGVSSLKKLSLLSYRVLKPFDCPSYYKLCAISRATGILAARRKSIRRGNVTKSPYAARSHLVAYYGFKIQNDSLRIPIGKKRYFDIPLVKHTLSVLSEAGVRVRSFTPTAQTVGLCISKEAKQVDCDSVAGVDMNLRGLTFGNEERVAHHDLSMTVVTAETTRSIVASFRKK